MHGLTGTDDPPSQRIITYVPDEVQRGTGPPRGAKPPSAVPSWVADALNDTQSRGDPPPGLPRDFQLLFDVGNFLSLGEWLFSNAGTEHYGAGNV
jgi:hypothetical protein